MQAAIELCKYMHFVFQSLEWQAIINNDKGVIIVIIIVIIFLIALLINDHTVLVRFSKQANLDFF